MCVHAHLRTYMHECMHTYIHACISRYVSIYISIYLSIYLSIRHRAVGTVACSNSRRRLQSLSPIIQSLQIQLQWESQSGDPAGVGVSSSSWSRSLESPVWSLVGGDPPPLLACTRVDCYPPEAPNSSLQPSFSRMSLHLEFLLRHIATNMPQHRPR